MTTTVHDIPTPEQQLEAFAETVFGAALGTAELAVASLGRELGIYSALRGQPGLTPAEVAVRAGIDPRYAREWLEHQAVAQVITVEDADRSGDERRYSLPQAHAVALLDEEHPAYIGALTELPRVIGHTLDQVREAFRTGNGVPYAAYRLHGIQAGFTRPAFANSLLEDWLPALPDLHARLEAGEPLRVLDVGCGEGWAGIYIAEAHPTVTVDGFDTDVASIAAAHRHAAERGLGERTRFETRDATDPGINGPYDLIFACEVIHDVPDPVGVLAAMRRLHGDGGAVLIVDEKAAESFTPSGDPIERLLYAFSVLHCLPVGRHAERSVATGTVMRPEVLSAYAREAGFTSVEILPIDHPMFRFYRPRA